MYGFRLVILGVSSVSAVVLNPDLLLISSPSTNRGNISTISDTAQSPQQISNMSEVALMSTNLTYSVTSMGNRQIEARCTDIAGCGPYAASCEDAVRYMAFVPPRFAESQQILWGRRDGTRVPNVLLPQEVISCKWLCNTETNQPLTGELAADGHCRINVHLRAAVSLNIARASQSQVKAGVSALISKCMTNQERPRGGAAIGFSEHYIFPMSFQLC